MQCGSEAAREVHSVGNELRDEGVEHGEEEAPHGSVEDDDITEEAGAALEQLLVNLPLVPQCADELDNVEGSRHLHEQQLHEHVGGVGGVADHVEEREGQAVSDEAYVLAACEVGGEPEEVGQWEVEHAQEALRVRFQVGKARDRAVGRDVAQGHQVVEPDLGHARELEGQDAVDDGGRVVN